MINFHLIYVLKEYKFYICLVYNKNHLLYLLYYYYRKIEMKNQESF